MFRLAILVACLSAVSAFAQLKLPALSPEAKVVQTAGLTTITVDYSSPAVKGRKIWGGLCPPHGGPPPHCGKSAFSTSTC